MLHISADYQLKRIKHRLEKPDKAWKFRPSDMEERKNGQNIWRHLKKLSNIPQRVIVHGISSLVKISGSAISSSARSSSRHSKIWHQNFQSQTLISRLRWIQSFEIIFLKQRILYNAPIWCIFILVVSLFFLFSDRVSGASVVLS